MLRIMLVDDHGFVRSAIRQALTAPDVEVVAEAATAEEALRLAPEVRPDVRLRSIVARSDVLDVQTDVGLWNRMADD